MSNRRGLTPDQRIAKNESDRRRREEHAMEFKRLKKAEVEWGDEIRHLREENGRLNQEYKNLNEILSNSNILDQLRGQKLGLHEHHLSLEKTLKRYESYLLGPSPSPSPNEELANNEHITHCPGSSQIDIQYAEELANNEHITHCPGSSQIDIQYAEELANNEHISHCPGSSQIDIQYAEELANNEHISHCPGSSQIDIQYAEELANNEHISHCPGSSQIGIQYAEELANNEHITHCPGSSQSGIQYADELVEDFIKKLDAKEKSKVDFSDFDGLKEEMETSGINSLPPSLAPFDTIIKENFGEIDADSRQSSCTAMPSRILFCAAIREMSKLQLENIDEKKILLWRDAINSALNINFKVEFAITHLKKIAHAYFCLKAWNERLNDPELMSIRKRISELKTEYHSLEAKYAQKVEARNSEMKKCVHGAEYFVGKSLIAGLFQ